MKRRSEDGGTADTSRIVTPSAFWPSFCLGIALVAVKVLHWRLPSLSQKGLTDYLTDVTVSAHTDVLFAMGVGFAAEAALRLTRWWPAVQRALWRGFLMFSTCCVVYAVASVPIFAYLRSPLTYPLLYLADDMSVMRSSLGSFVSAPLVLGLFGAPVLFVDAVRRLVRRPRPAPALPVRVGQVAALVGLLGTVLWAHRTAEGRWRDRDDHLIVKNPHWELIASSVRAFTGESSALLDIPFSAEDLDDFETPRGRRASSGPPAVDPGGPPRSRSLRARGAAPLTSPPGPRLRNVALVILESTGARYLSLYGSPYETTPCLDAESDHALVFDRFYCHVGLTANSLVALTLSVYTYMTWREYTHEYPDYPGQTLANVLKPHGYRTAFLHSGDFRYVDQDRFLQTRGFDVLRDIRDLGTPPLSSWGTDDRHLVDDALRWIDEDPQKPFHLVAFTSLSHHPYEPSPEIPFVDFFRGRPLPPDDYDLGRYLNTIRQVDAQLGRFFDGLRARGLAEDTLVVITGDHGEAFGDPHRTWGHGARIYEENVRVPLVVWNPRLFRTGRRSQAVGGHVDLNPTVADLLGLPQVDSWEGRSLFDGRRPPRTYFYAANDDYLLGVREGNLKYVYNATRGHDELYDVSRDPEEQRNLASSHPEVCRRLRRRLAAWRDYAGRQLAQVRQGSGR